MFTMCGNYKRRFNSYSLQTSAVTTTSTVALQTPTGTTTSTVLAAAPISDETCGIMKVFAAGTPDYYPYGFQCMRAEELKLVETKCKQLFNQVNPPAGSVAEWSDNVEAARLYDGQRRIIAPRAPLRERATSHYCTNLTAA